MIEETAASLVALAEELAGAYGGGSRLREAIPKGPSDLFPLDRDALDLLHRFAAENPIYHDSFEAALGGTDCIVYEGDINRYWLGSIQHGSSRAPFSPTWIMSAYVGTLLARGMGYSEVVDIGSGDGRISYCAMIQGMRSFSIEIDDALADLQRSLANGPDLHVYCDDAAEFDYHSLPLARPVFFVGGLAQMGGTSLVSRIMQRGIPATAGWVFAGTASKKYAPDPLGGAGWGTLMARNGLNAVKTVVLPTAWTLHEPDKTPYVLAEHSNPN